MFIFYVDLKLASSLMTCCLLSIVESKLNPSISKEIPIVLQMTGFCAELTPGMFQSLVVEMVGIGVGISASFQGTCYKLYVPDFVQQEHAGCSVHYCRVYFWVHRLAVVYFAVLCTVDSMDWL